MMKEQVFAQAMLLAGSLDSRQVALLKVLCTAAASSLELRLRDGLTPDSCGEDFVAAASLMAIAHLGEVEEEVQIEEFKAGDLTVKQGTASRDAAASCLLRQAEQLMKPYLKDRFAFVGV